MCRQTSSDTLTGIATQTYDDGQVQPGDEIPTIKELWPFLEYFKAMHSTKCINCFTNHRGHTHNVTSTTSGQQGDGLEMLRFSLSQHPIWGRVLARHRRARGIAFADDSYIYASLNAGEDAKLRFNLCVGVPIGTPEFVNAFVR